MDKLHSISKKITPYQLLLLGYIFITVTGAFLLSLPISSRAGTHQPFLDSLFLATSGISTSGLSVVDIGSYYSLFGQIVLMTVFQIGGIGYMIFIVLMMYLLRIKASIKTSIIAKESMAGSSLGLFNNFFINVLIYTFIFEFIGAIILSFVFSRNYSITYSIYLGIFHSISAFCTAGFSTFSDNLMKYQFDSMLNITIIIVSLAGGLGFFVLKDITVYLVKKIKKQYPYRLTIHSKLVLTVTAIIILISTIIIFFVEAWPETTSTYQKILVSIFQTVSASTTDGYNSIDIGKMGTSSLTILMFLMFVGASPGSTGGGIKTTTLGVLFILLLAKLKEKRNNIFGREIPDKSVYNTIIVFLCFIIIMFMDTIILSITEKSSYIQILFEICSALGNTGLSTGITSALSKTGKAVLIVTMFIGRVGPLSIAYAVLSKPEQEYFRYPKEDVFIG